MTATVLVSDAETGDRANFDVLSGDQLLTSGSYQLYTYWNTAHKAVIGWRLGAGAWTWYTYDGTGGLPDIQKTDNVDSHYRPTVGVDSDGYVHFVYDHHSNPLNYRRSDAALGAWAGALTAPLSMVGTHETEVTYPMLFNDPSGVLYCIFRDGGSAQGDWYLYQYTTATTSWAAAAGTGSGGIVINGKTDTIVAYLHGIPAFDSDFGSGGFMHLFWTWYDVIGVTPTWWDVGYVKWNGTNWYQSDGSAQPIPITDANDEQVVATGNQENDLWYSGYTCVDSNGYPHIAYIGPDDAGDSQIKHLYWNGSAWVQTQVTETSGNERYPSRDITAPAIAIASTLRLPY